MVNSVEQHAGLRQAAAHVGDGLDQVITLQDHVGVQEIWACYDDLLWKLLEGMVSGDALSPVFSSKKLLRAPMDMSRNNFEYFQIFVELFVLVVNSLDCSPVCTMESRGLPDASTLYRPTER